MLPSARVLYVTSCWSIFPHLAGVLLLWLSLFIDNSKKIIRCLRSLFVTGGGWGIEGVVKFNLSFVN